MALTIEGSMSGSWDPSLGAALAAHLASLGYTPDHSAIREAAIPAARGQSVVLTCPPSSRYALPALAGLLASAGREPGRVLLLAPGYALEEWSHTVIPLARAASLSLEIARTPARAARRLRAHEVQLLLTSPEVALELERRSTLQAAALTHLVLAWPDRPEDPDALTAVLQDANREAQRLVQLATPAAARDLVDRFARRAVLAGSERSAAPPVPSVRTVTVGWGQRGPALGQILETLDPGAAVVWALDNGSAADAAEFIPPGANVTVTTGDVTRSGPIITYDLPDADRLRQLATAGEVIVITPAYAATSVDHLAATRRPMQLNSGSDSAQSRAAARRASIEASMRDRDATGALLALAPLFERHDPANVAAALYDLWSARAPVEVKPPASLVPAIARIWVGTGKKDEVTPNDIVATLTRELRMDKGRIGKIDVRELYCLVEVPAEEAEEVAGRLNGMTIRRRRVTARVDRGAGGKNRPR
jgi:DbpA-like RNA binding protein